ncbi:uncharacterized protein LOC119389461 isoform X3 [Rhipicephalus sanguineus]|uniref:uncharacterized protein LOC119389461 isoform X3 n=1 Tax=Rhipicephalus sanguineus TaxID=34632 RepID=UPI0020C40EE3|nr:uncharacterized protein LOC119389461 isoform X3 [Rhipicephalus sanguineus]
MGSLQNAVGAESGTAASGRESPPASFSQLGIPTGPDLRNTTLFGPIKPLSAVSRLEWAFFTISSLSLIVSLGFTVERLISLEKNTDDYTFAIMLCFTSLFCFFYIVHGILKERYHEIAVFIFSSILLLVYLILNVVSPSQTAGASIEKKVRLGVAVFFLLGIIYLGGRVAHGYWSERRLLFRINAKEDLQAMLGWLFLCSSLIFFDVQLQGTMLIFVMNHGTDLSRTEIIVLAVGPVVTVLWAIAGECTIRKESKIWLSIFVLLWFPNVVYIGLKLYDWKPLGPIRHSQLSMLVMKRKRDLVAWLHTTLCAVGVPTCALQECSCVDDQESALCAIAHNMSVCKQPTNMEVLFMSRC